MRIGPIKTKIDARSISNTEAAVLGLLEQGERSGYDLWKLAGAGVAYVWAPAKSQIYAVLPRLVADGLSRRRDVVQSARPDKRLYRTTRAGERALRRWVEEPAWRSHDEFLLKVFLGRLTTTKRLTALVTAYRRVERGRLDEYREIERRIAGEEASLNSYATLRWGLAAVRARIRWADDFLHELAGREASAA